MSNFFRKIFKNVQTTKPSKYFEKYVEILSGNDNPTSKIEKDYDNKEKSNNKQNNDEKMTVEDSISKPDFGKSIPFMVVLKNILI